MIYLKEIYLRLSYFIFSSFLLIFSLYLLRDDFLLFFLSPTFFSNYSVNYFIFINPSEAFFFFFYIGFFFFCVFILPYIIWSFFDYCKPSFFFYENKKIADGLICVFLIMTLFNIACCYGVFPFIWNFFTGFDLITVSHIPLFLELSMFNYLNFFFKNFFVDNVLFIFFFCLLCTLFYYIDNARYLINLKKCCIIFGLFFSTLATPPQLELQIFLFVSLYLCVEFFFFFFFLLKIYSNYFIYTGSQLKVNKSEKIKTRYPRENGKKIFQPKCIN